MTQQPSLEQLNDIVEPNDASWWPPSWVTLAVAIIVLVGVTIFLIWMLRRWQKSRVRKTAMAQLLQQKDCSVEQLTVLLKRIALAYYPRELIAEKHSQNWLNFLFVPLSDKEKALFEPLLEQADKNFYGMADDAFNQSYYQLAKVWLSKDLSKQPGADNV
ncbi:DUF4381 domain-containing protein [Idiomarina ramblicola]|uniref:DUF4381 domain-containing protein n=1 Tax=Idiomarina ramblicola TaxID=263724 RepID=A0A432YZA4_9GAMM|nr:DUF4381 domain-containing protein [Idiomarina ramblicola]RUO68944.1 DUF4381 domain-containing protein [Idiomarina ramblicola]